MMQLFWVQEVISVFILILFFFVLNHVNNSCVFMCAFFRLEMFLSLINQVMRDFITDDYGPDI